MRKLLPALTLLVFASSADATTISASASQASVSPGDTILVNLSLSNVSDLYAFQFNLTFTPGILSAQSIAESGYFLANGVSFLPGSIDNSAGTLTLVSDALSGIGSSFTGSTPLAVVTFTAQNSGTAQIIPTNVVLLKSDLSDISVTAAGTAIQVGPASVPEASTATLLCLGLGLTIFLQRRSRFGEVESDKDVKPSSRTRTRAVSRAT